MKRRAKNQPCRGRASARPVGVHETVVAALTGHLRATALRREIAEHIEESGAGVDPEAIDRALCDPGVQAAVNHVTQAVLFEQGVATLRRIIDAASNNESWACKLLLELTGLAETSRASRPAGDSAADAVFLDSAKRNLARHLHEMVHGPQKKDLLDAED